MEFYEWIEKIISFIPLEYAQIGQAAADILPLVFLGFALLTCLFGYKLHKLWITVSFSVISFLAVYFIAAFVGGNDQWIDLYIAIGAAAGILVGFFAHRLNHLGLFLMNFFLAYGGVSHFVSRFAPGWLCVLLGLLAALVVGILVVRFKYIVTMAVTSFSGAVTAAHTISGMYFQDNVVITYLFMVGMAALGLVVQLFLERKHIRKRKEEYLSMFSKSGVKVEEGTE